jgi:MFS transporter, ACS family, D-galactonate transporter
VSSPAQLDSAQLQAIAGAQIWIALLVVRSLMGLFTVPLHPGAARAAGNWFAPEQQSLANGLITGASILAYAVVHPVFGSLIDRFNWPIAFVITGAVTALLALAWWLFATDHPAGFSKPQTQGAEVESVSTAEPQNFRSNLILITLSYSAVGYFQYLFFYWLHYYFESVLHMDKTESRYLTGLPSLAMAASMPLGGWITDRIVRWRGDVSARALVPKIGMIVSAVLLACGIFAKDRFWIVACFTASLAVLGLCEAAFWTVAVSLGGERGGTSAAIMNTGGNGIGLLAPMITPWIGTHLGWGWGLGVGAIIGLLGGLCWFGIKLHDESTSSATAL